MAEDLFKWYADLQYASYDACNEWVFVCIFSFVVHGK